MNHGPIDTNINVQGWSVNVCPACADVIGEQNGTAALVGGGWGHCDGWGLAEYYRRHGYSEAEARDNLASNGDPVELLNWEAVRVRVNLTRPDLQRFES